MMTIITASERTTSVMKEAVLPLLTVLLLASMCRHLDATTGAPEEGYRSPMVYEREFLLTLQHGAAPEPGLLEDIPRELIRQSQVQRARRARRRGRRGGIRHRLRRRSNKPPLPSILLSNARSLRNKIDELHINARVCHEYRPPPSVEVPVGPYPFLVRSVDGRQVPVVQAYAFGKYLGHLHIRFDDEGNVLEAHGNPILLDESIPEDPDVLNQVEEWKENLKSFSSQVVGRTLVFLNGSNEECRFRECNLGNLICDAMVDSALGFSEDLQWNHVSAALMNGGGVRNSIDEETRNGSITMEDLLSVLPFGGTIDLVSLKGSTLKKAFEHSVHRYGQSTGEFLQVSGFQVEVDLTMPPYSRVRALRILCTRCRVPTFDPVQDDSVYRVLMPSYMVTGGDGFSMIPDEMVKHNSGDLDISVVSAFLSKRGVVHPAVEGRIRIVSSASVSVTSVCALLPLLLWGAL